MSSGTAVRRPRRCLVLLGAVLVATPALAQYGARNGEWRTNGGDNGFTHYSPLSQIDAGNVAKLAVMWESISPDAPVVAAHPELAEHPQMAATNLEGVPLMVSGVVYMTTSFSQAFAVDAATGRTLWTYDPKSYDSGKGHEFFVRGPAVNRGPAYWSDGKEGRLFIGTFDARLIALDPKTGVPVKAFGKGGQIDTREGIPRIAHPDQYGACSAPAVCRDVVTMGARVADRVTTKSMPPGWIRGWDVRTGKQLWVFHSVPVEGEPATSSWENESWKTNGNTNVWSMISADDELGTFYLPFGTASNDFYGGDRHGDNLYAESLVCLDAKSGRMLWQYQTVHHGLWDYDLPTPPVLCDITVGGRKIKALAQLTKQGFTFVFDRATGKPVWPIEERPVPQSDVPGERSSPTQPFPTKPPPFERQGVMEDDLIDFTPALRAEAVEIAARYVHGQLFTPPSLQGTLALPCAGGGANWPGAAFDPETGWLYVPSMTRVSQMKLGAPDPSRSEVAYAISDTQVAGPQGLPLVKPPYGRVTAIDLNRGEHAWMVTNGGDGPLDHPALKGLNLPPLGTAARAAVLATKTLLFVSEGSGRIGSATGGGNHLRALDKVTGKEIWRIDLGAQITSNPITFSVQGRQLIVVPVGSDPPKLVALGLP